MITKIQLGSPSKTFDRILPIIIAVVSIAAALVLTGLKFKEATQTAEVEAATVGLIFALLLGSAGFILRLWYRIDQLRDYISEMSRSPQKVEEATQEYAINAAVRSKTEQFHDVVKGTIISVLDHNSGLIRTTPAGFVLGTRDIARLANREFWKLLANLQSQNKRKQIKVKITHSTSINLWEGRDADESLAQQVKFVDQGGEIIRIIEGSEKREDVVAETETKNEVVKAYRRVIKKMQDAYKIKVKYVEGIHSSEEYDFTWVHLSDANLGPDIAMLWYASQNSQTIYQCEISTDKIDEISSRWESLEHLLTRLEREEQSNRGVGGNQPIEVSPPKTKAAA
jgi:hypothetical protein